MDKLVISRTYSIGCGDGRRAVGYLAYSEYNGCYAIVGDFVGHGKRGEFPIAVEFYPGQVQSIHNDVIMLKTQDEQAGL